MTPWQLLRSGRVTPVALGHHVHRGGLVHYGSAPAASPTGSRSFCLSRERVGLQQLNSRLASYLQQVQSLEAANQKLESQIQKELDRKSPSQLRELDGHLRTVSLLQDQISECLSAQAQVKLQLLSSELSVFDLSVRCEKEREHRGCLEVELSDLRLLEEEVQVHRLPELQNLLSDLTHQLTGMQIQHRQDTQALLAQMTGTVTVEMQPTESLDLIQQLDHLRQMSLTQLNQNQNECWFNNQVSMLRSPKVTFDPPPGSEVLQAELEELRSRAASLEEELTHLQAVNAVLEASGLEQNTSFIQQLLVLQQRADSLCADLDSVLQAAAQQAADHLTLLDLKTRLETEIQDYRRLLDGLSPEGYEMMMTSDRVSGFHQDPTVNITSLCTTTSPTAFRRNKTVRVQGGALKKKEDQAVSRGRIRNVRKTLVVAPLSENLTTVQSNRIQGKQSKKSPVALVNTSSLNGSLLKTENQRRGKESRSISATVNKQRRTVEDKVHGEHCDFQNSSTVNNNSARGVKRECNAETGITASVPDTQPVDNSAVQAKPQSVTSKQITTEDGWQVNETETNVQTIITKTSLCAESDEKEGPHFIEHKTTTDPSIYPSAKVKKEIETEDFIQAKNQDPAQVGPFSAETPARQVAFTASCASGSHSLGSEEAKVHKYVERQEVEGTFPVIRLDKVSALSHASNSERNKVMEAEMGSVITNASPGIQDSDDNLEGKPPPGIITLVPDTQPVRNSAVQTKPETFTSKQTAAEAGFQSNKAETIIQSVITKTSLCAEPEVKQGPHSTIGDPSKNTALGVQKETEPVVSTQMNLTEGPIQAKNQDPAQVVPLSFETLAEAVGESGEVAVTASCVSGSHILRSEEVPGKVSGGLTMNDDKDIKVQDKKGEEVEGTLPVIGLDHISVSSHASKSEQNKVMVEAEMGSSITNASPGILDSDDNLESKPPPGIITLVPDTQPVRNSAVQTEPETYTPKQTTAEVQKETEPLVTAQMNLTEGSIQAKNQDPTQVLPLSLETPAEAVVEAREAAVTVSCVSGSHTLRSEDALVKVSDDLTMTDTNKVMEHADTEFGITNTSSGILDSNESLESKPPLGIITLVPDKQPLRNQDSAQVVPLSLETPEESVGKAEEAAVTVSCVSGSDTLRSEEAPVQVSGDLILMNDKDTEIQKTKGEEVVEEVKGTNHEQNKVKEDAHTWTNIATAPSRSPGGSRNLHNMSKTTENLNAVEFEMNNGKFHYTDEVKMDHVETDSLLSKGAGQEASLTTTGSKKSSTDSGMALRECLSPGEAQVFWCTAKLETCLSPEIPLSPVEPKVSMSRTDQVFCPIHVEDPVRSPDPHLRPNESSTCLSPVEAEVCLSPNGVEEDEVCPTEANAHGRPVEKYILSTKEEGQSLSFSSDPAVPEEDRNRTVRISMGDGSSLCFGSFQDNKGSRSILNGSNKSTTIIQDIGLKLNKSLRSFEFAGPVHRSIITDKEEQLSFGGQYKEKGASVNNKGFQILGDGRGDRYGSEDQKKICNIEGEVKGEKSSDRPVSNLPGNRERVLNVFVKSPSKHDVASDLAASFGGTAAKSSGTLNGNAEAAVPVATQGRFRCDSGEWLVYGGSCVHKSSLDGSSSLLSKAQEIDLSVATNPPTSLPESKTGSVGSGEWRVYGGSSGRLSRWAGSDSLSNADREELSPVPKELATSPPGSLGTGRFGSGGSGEWRVYGGSTGHLSRWAGSDRLSNADREDNPPVVMELANSPPGLLGTGRFAGGGSGEWRVYGGSTERLSKWAAMNSLPNTDREAISPVPIELATSPPGSLGTGRFGSGGSGKWRVYGGSTESLSKWAGSDNLPRADSKENPSVASELATSPPGSLGTGRFGSGGSGEWRVYGGSTERLNRASSTDRVSANRNQMISPPNSQTGSRSRLGAGSGGRLSLGSVVKRSSSIGSGGRASTSGRFSSPGSSEWKPVYRSSSARKGSMGSSGRSIRSPSPGRRMSTSMGSRWVSPPVASEHSTSSTGSVSKLSSTGGSDGISSEAGGRTSGSSMSGRTNSTGGRVISSSDRPIRSTGSGAGGKKERISVCKMAALSISAARREKSQDKQRKQQPAAGPSPLLRRWLNT